MRVVSKPKRRRRRLVRDCPVEECQHRIQKNMLMCRRHWRQVPKVLRDTQCALLQDLALAFDDDAKDFIVANVVMNQQRCIAAAADM